MMPGSGSPPLWGGLLGRKGMGYTLGPQEARPWLGQAPGPLIGLYLFTFPRLEGAPSIFCLDPTAASVFLPFSIIVTLPALESRVTCTNNGSKSPPSLGLGRVH
jgi:hypothetical protein